MSYADARFGSRWLSDGSEMTSVQRRRIVVFGGRFGMIVGIGFVTWAGRGFVRVWFKASAE